MHTAQLRPKNVPSISASQAKFNSPAKVKENVGTFLWMVQNYRLYVPVDQ